MVQLNRGQDMALWSGSRGSSDLGGGVLNSIQNSPSVV